jgi:hypothetical protein
MLQIEKDNLVAAITNGSSEWARIPIACATSGIGKSRFYELLNESRGKIKTLLLKSPGARSGARLIHIPSLLAYLDSMAAEQQGGQSQ